MILFSPGNNIIKFDQSLIFYPFIIIDILSRADFWALAGIYAVDKTIELNNDNCDDDDCVVPDSGLVFQWGREVFTLLLRHNV